MNEQSTKNPRNVSRKSFARLLLKSTGIKSSLISKREAIKRTDPKSLKNQEEMASYVISFRKKIEAKNQKSSTNQNYTMRRGLTSINDRSLSSGDQSIQSLEDVGFYDLSSQNQSKKMDLTDQVIELMKNLSKMDESTLSEQLR